MCLEKRSNKNTGKGDVAEQKKLKKAPKATHRVVAFGMARNTRHAGNDVLREKLHFRRIKDDG